MRIAPICCSLLLTLVWGCDEPPPDDDAGGGGDAGASDAGSPDVDAGPRLDAGPRDSGGVDAGIDAAPGEYTLGGTVTGLTEAVALTLNGAEEIVVRGDGAFVFTTPVVAYDVVVSGVADADYCRISAPSGVLSTDGSDALTVDCVAGHTAQLGEIEYELGVITSAWRLESPVLEGGDYREVEFRSTGPGADGLLFTDDDPGLEGELLEGNTANTDNTLETSIVNAGADGLFGTIDDVLSEYTARSFITPEVVGRRSVYESPGPSGEWRTADDILSEVSFRSLYEVDAQDRRLCSARWGVGLDRVFETPDDVELSYSASSYTMDATFNLMREDLRSGGNGADFGDDGVPCTGDDVDRVNRRFWRDSSDRLVMTFTVGQTSYLEDRFDSATSPNRFSIRWGLGPNATLDGPDRGDDEIQSYFRSIFDASDRRVFFAQTLNAGVDGDYFTGDDTFRGNPSFSVFDPNGVTGESLTERFQYTEGTPLAGADGVIGSPDDVAVSYQHYVYQSGVQVCVAQANDPGPNGTWDVRGCGNESRLGGALDDAMEFVDWVMFDAMDRPTREGHSTAPGTDGLWASDDDALSTATHYEYPDAETTLRFEHGDFGTDGVPFTADDVISRVQATRVDVFSNVVFTATIQAPGPDGVYLTEDDLDDGWTEHQRDAAGGLVGRSLHEEGPGPDGLSYNADDPVTREETHGRYPAEPFL